MFQWRVGDTIGCVLVLVSSFAVVFFLGFVVRGC